MRKSEDPEILHDKMVMIANLYYKQKLSQAEIAKQLGISRPWVSKLLTKAEDVGIVQINIEAPIAGESLLSEKLKEKYNLHYASVIDASDGTKDSLSEAAANYFIAKIHSDDVIGMGWGDTVYRFLQKVPSASFPKLQIVPLSGSFGLSRETLPNYVSMRLADLLGGTALPLHAPAFCESQMEYDALINSESTSTVLKKAEEANLAVVGLGSMESSFITRNHILPERDLNLLLKDHAVGDIALQYLDQNGEPVNNEVTSRIIKADFLKLRQNAREVIGIAHGKDKVSIIKAVLSNQLVTSFFTDCETALALLTI